MNKRVLVSIMLVTLTIILLGGTGMVMARTQAQQTPLAQLVLQPDDLPGDNVNYYAEKVEEDRFLGDPSPVNIPLEAEGFLEAYAADAFYPVTLRNSESPGGAFILNIVYQYQDEAQARQALEQQLEWFNSADIALDARIEQLDEHLSIDAAKIQGRAFELTYSQEGLIWNTYWLFGVKENVLVFLMVDGPPDPATQEVFSTLATKVIQRQDW
jgi:hypothetical protein